MQGAATKVRTQPEPRAAARLWPLRKIGRAPEGGRIGAPPTPVTHPTGTPAPALRGDIDIRRVGGETAGFLSGISEWGGL
ncbi:MAG: hypothetical protein AMXMBFR83_02030 [Phycisphaerae bacterium]